MATTQIAATQLQQNKWVISQAIIEYGLLILLAALLLWQGVIPGWKVLNSDFPNYYVAARLIRKHYVLDRIYEWIWFQRAADHFGADGQLAGFLGLTPFSAIPILPLAWLPVLVAKRVWIVVNLALLAGSVELLKRQTGLGRTRVWLIALCAAIPLRSSFLSGQMHILVLALLVVAYVCHMRGWQIGSGCFIAVAAALKIYPIFFCGYFLLKRRWRALGAAVVFSALCWGLSWWMVGQGAMSAYVFEQLPRSLQGESGNPFLASVTASSALFHRLFLYEPELNPHPLIYSPQLYTLLYPLWQALLVGMVFMRLRFGFRSDDREAIDWSMFLCLLMFLSSAPASYQFVVLIAAAVPTIAVLVGQRRSWAALVYLSLYFLACNIRTIRLNSPTVSIFTPVFYLTLWCGVALLVFYYFVVKPDKRDIDKRDGARSVPLLRRPAFGAAVVVLFLWVAGSRSAWSHLRNRTSGQQLINPDGAYLRTSPRGTDGGIVYVAMQLDGYQVRNAEAPLSETLPGLGHAGDQLSFASNSTGKDVWVEVASNRGSRVVHLVSGIRVPICEIDDGENSAISSDDTRLAFLREDKGQGSVWVIDLRECAAHGGESAAVRVTPPGFDVRTLAAGSGESFLMSAMYQGKERIYTVSPGEEPQLLAESNWPLNSTALSPDGKVLIARELIRHRWQLASLDLSTHTWKQLTNGDCNEYTPSWSDNQTLLYATDCRRGMGLTALASLKVDR